MTLPLQQVVATAEDLVELERRVSAASARATEALAGILAQQQPVQVLARMKFEPIGFHPFQDRTLNLIEQVNQTFTIIASLRAAAWIFDHHPAAGPLRLNLGTAPGSDLESLDGSLAAEAFAATSPASNNKLAKDVAKVAATAAVLKFAFYCCPGVPAGDPVAAKRHPGVFAVSLGWQS